MSSETPFYTDQLTRLEKRALLFADERQAYSAAGAGTGKWGVVVYSGRERGWYVYDPKSGRYLADPLVMPKRQPR
jgi:hypothetical protein